MAIEYWLNSTEYGDCSMPNVTYDLKTRCECGGNPTAQVVIGIIIHVLGSVGINVGQNLQAMGLMAMDPSNRGKCKMLVRNKLWSVGCAMFLISSIVNFGVLTLAPASLLVPLEAVQFIVNVFFGKFVRKVFIPFRVYLGVALMCAGVALAVTYGEQSSPCFTEDELKNFWRPDLNWAWWLYIIITFGISILCFVFHHRLWKLAASGKAAKHSSILMPIMYALPSALMGGGQMIVQSKCLSELFELMVTTLAEGNGLPEGTNISGWFFWVELLLVSGFGIFWFYRLTDSLGKYDPLIIIPLMQASFIVFGGIAGGIFFKEFQHLGEHAQVGQAAWALYILGILLICFGLYNVSFIVTGKANDQEMPSSGGAGAVTTTADAVAADADAKSPKLDASPGESATKNGSPSPNGGTTSPVIPMDPVNSM